MKLWFWLWFWLNLEILLQNLLIWWKIYKGYNLWECANHTTIDSIIDISHLMLAINSSVNVIIYTLRGAVTYTCITGPFINYVSMFLAFFDPPTHLVSKHKILPNPPYKLCKIFWNPPTPSKFFVQMKLFFLENSKRSEIISLGDLLKK